MARGLLIPSAESLPSSPRRDGARPYLTRCAPPPTPRARRHAPRGLSPIAPGGTRTLAPDPWLLPTSGTRSGARRCSVAPWPTSRSETATRSSSCTATRRRRTSGATSSRTSTALGRCIAPDLIGMGDSEKLAPSGPDRYRFVEHRALPRRASSRPLGVARARHARHPRLGLGARLRLGEPPPRRGARASPTWRRSCARSPGREWPDAARPVFQAFRSPAGEKMVLEQNVFVERVLPGVDPAQARRRRDGGLPPPVRSSPARAAGRRSPGRGRSRSTASRPTSSASSQDYARVARATRACRSCFVNAEPGAILRRRRSASSAAPGRTSARSPCSGIHFVQEDSPDEIGTAVAEWMRTREAA